MLVLLDSPPPHSSVMIGLLLLLAPALAIHHYSHIEHYAPPITLPHPPPAPYYEYAPPPSTQYGAPPHTPSPYYGAPPETEGSFSSPGSTQPLPVVPIPAPAPSTPEYQPSPSGGNELVLPRGTSLSLRDNLGQFSHGYSDKDGTTVSEQGRLFNTNDGWEAVIVKKGSYSYVSPEGTPISVNYVADENGFRASGSHIPK